MGKPFKPGNAVNHPAHYNMSAIEVIDAIDAWGLGFCLGNAVKYIARADHKDKPLEDLAKARWYLDHELEQRKISPMAAENHGPWLDDDGYPTDAALARIAAWPISKRADVHALIEFVRELWAYANAGYFGVTEEAGEPPTWNLSTAGWSGNEYIIEALERNALFWFVCWKSSRRGGHYEFQAHGVAFSDDPKKTEAGL